jgi:hypothetical protein
MRRIDGYECTPGAQDRENRSIGVQAIVGRNPDERLICRGLDACLNRDYPLSQVFVSMALAVDAQRSAVAMAIE